jgi:hypothetical protein
MTKESSLKLINVSNGASNCAISGGRKIEIAAAIFQIASQ